MEQAYNLMVAGVVDHNNLIALEVVVVASFVVVEDRKEVKVVVGVLVKVQNTDYIVALIVVEVVAEEKMTIVASLVVASIAFVVSLVASFVASTFVVHTFVARTFEVVEIDCMAGIELGEIFAFVVDKFGA